MVPLRPHCGENVPGVVCASDPPVDRGVAPHDAVRVDVILEQTRSQRVGIHGKPRPVTQHRPRCSPPRWRASSRSLGCITVARASPTINETTPRGNTSFKQAHGRTVAAFTEAPSKPIFVESLPATCSLSRFAVHGTVVAQAGARRPAARRARDGRAPKENRAAGMETAEAGTPEPDTPAARPRSEEAGGARETPLLDHYYPAVDGPALRLPESPPTRLYIARSLREERRPDRAAATSPARAATSALPWAAPLAPTTFSRATRHRGSARSDDAQRDSKS